MTYSSKHLQDPPVPKRQPKVQVRKPRAPKASPKKRNPKVVEMPRGAGKSTPRQRMLAKLKESRLDEKDAKLMQLEPMTEAQAADLKLPVTPTGGFLIPYFYPDGKTMPRTEMFRYRNFDTVIEKVATNGFLKNVPQRSVIPKYLQPKGTLPHLYFPPYCDWEEIMRDPDCPVYLTEGELKAACACKMGYYTLGLGGVFSFGSKALGWKMLPELREFTMNREWVIVFDSDASINRDIVIAESHLAGLLSDAGGLVKAVRLPHVLRGQDKTGWDDFLVRPTGKEEFERLLNETGLYADLEEKYRLNEEVIHVLHPSMIVEHPKPNHPQDQDRYRTMTCDTFKNEAYADRYIRVISPDASASVKPTPAASAWMKWPGRAKVDSMTYAPGEDRIVNGNQFNTWEGWGCEPAKGDVGPFLDLFNHLSKGLSAEERNWFLQWLAWPIQHPGIEGKLHTAVVLYGAGGSGKSSLGYTMKEVYGDPNFSEATHDDLVGQYNGWMRHKQFILGEEMTGNHPEDVRNVADIMKHRITGQKIIVKVKYIPEYSLPNTSNFLLTSNHDTCADIDNDDRRYFIHEVPREILPTEFWVNYYRWLKQEGGAASVHYYLRYEVDTSDFKPKAPAPRTEARQDMLEEIVARTPAGRLAVKLLRAESAAAFFGQPYAGRDIWPLEHILLLKNPVGVYEDRRINESTLGAAMKKLGFRRTVTSGKRLWVVFKPSEYEKWSDTDIVKAYEALLEKSPKSPAQKVSEKVSKRVSKS